MTFTIVFYCLGQPLKVILENNRGKRGKKALSPLKSKTSAENDLTD